MNHFCVKTGLIFKDKTLNKRMLALEEKALNDNSNKKEKG